MLLGFISLILTLVEEKVTNICINEKYYDKEWIPIEFVHECDSCLSKTKRLSHEFYVEHDCSENSHHEPHDSEQTEGHDYEHHYMVDQRKLLTDAESSSTCKSGEVQFISGKALHEVHTLIFLLAVIHAFVVALMVLIASFRIRQWKKWIRKDQLNGILTLDPRTWEVCIIPKPNQPSTSNGYTPPNETPENTVENGNNGTVIQVENTRTKWMTRCNTCVPDLSDEGNSSGIRGPPVMDIRASRTEWKIAFFKQFWHPINRKEFQLLRSAFIVEHKRAEHFDFENYLFNSLDDDIRKVVEIPYAAWIAIVIGYTLWAPMHDSAWPILGVLVILEIIVIVFCTKLVTIVRLLTANEQVHKFNEAAFWQRDPRFLLPLIRAILSTNSFIPPFLLSAGWQYGFESCPLTGKVGDDIWIHKAAAPLLLIVNLLCFIHISWILMPVYSVTVHMSSDHFSKHLLPPTVIARLHGWIADVKKGPGPKAHETPLTESNSESGE
eukprot:g1976.t1